MTIEPIANGCLRVWLTDTELEQWGLQGQEPSARRLRRLLRRIAAAAAWSNPPQVTVELIPIAGGGLLLVSPWKHPEADTPTVYRMWGEDALLDVLRRWAYIDDETPSCAVFAAQGAYYLAVYPTAAISDCRRHMLLEYGTPVGEGVGAVAHWREYGTLLWAGWFMSDPAPLLPNPADWTH